MVTNFLHEIKRKKIGLLASLIYILYILYYFPLVSRVSSPRDLRQAPFILYSTCHVYSSVRVKYFFQIMMICNVAGFNYYRVM